jgi:hypothetical protein
VKKEKLRPPNESPFFCGKMSMAVFLNLEYHIDHPSISGNFVSLKMKMAPKSPPGLVIVSLIIELFTLSL